MFVHTICSDTYMVDIHPHKFNVSKHLSWHLKFFWSIYQAKWINHKLNGTLLADKAFHLLGLLGPKNLSTTSKLRENVTLVLVLCSLFLFKDMKFVAYHLFIKSTIANADLQISKALKSNENRKSQWTSHKLNNIFLQYIVNCLSNHNIVFWWHETIR